MLFFFQEEMLRFSFVFSFSILLSLSLSYKIFLKIHSNYFHFHVNFFARALCQIFNLSVKIVFECAVDN